MTLVRKLIHELAGAKEGRLDFLINAFIGAYNRRTDVLAKSTQGSDSEQYKAIIEMLHAQAGVAAEVALLKEEISVMHQLLVELGSP